MSGKSFLEVVEVVLGGLVIICLLWKRMVVETTPRQATSEEKFDQKKKRRWLNNKQNLSLIKVQRLIRITDLR